MPAHDFRSPRLTLLALLPLAMGVVLSLGILGLFGLPLNPANMIAFPLILGVGVGRESGERFDFGLEFVDAVEDSQGRLAFGDLPPERPGGLKAD